MATAPGFVAPLVSRAMRNLVRKGISIVKERFPTAGKELRNLEPALARNVKSTGRLQGHQQSAYQQAQEYIKQNVRHFSSSAGRAGSGGARKAGGTRIGHAVGRMTATAPFASTLRPRLTCGAFPRSSGGFSMGGSARFYSHTPVVPADVIAQVSQAMRAFVLSGKDVAYNNRRGGHRSYVKGQIRAQLAAASTDCLAPGAYVDFRLAPTLKCLSPYEPVGTTCLDNVRGGFLDELSSDISEIATEMSAIFQDIRRISSLGDLPITLVDMNTLRVHFRGCDAELVNRLCDEVGVCRGIVHEDERFAFGHMAPSAASEVDWKDMMSSSSSSGGSMFGDDHDNYGDEIMTLPSWTESEEEFYDEIDPGGLSSSSSDSSYVISRQPLEGLEYFDAEEHGNPWAASSVRSISTSA